MAYWWSIADTLPRVNLARNAERRLERLVEGIAGRMFKGNLHPVELARG